MFVVGNTKRLKFAYNILTKNITLAINTHRRCSAGCDQATGRESWTKEGTPILA